MTRLKLPAKKVYGRLLVNPETDLTTVVLLPDSEPGGETVYMRFALVLLGIERLLLPAFVLDDWGREKSKLSLYEWIYTNGDYFPRAEIFGYYQHPAKGWEEAQYFVRDLELTARWPLFVCPDRHAPPAQNQRVQAVARESADCQAPLKIKVPDDIKMPLKRAAVSWWEIPPGYQGTNFL